MDRELCSSSFSMGVVVVVVVSEVGGGDDEELSSTKKGRRMSSRSLCRTVRLVVGPTGALRGMMVLLLPQMHLQKEVGGLRAAAVRVNRMLDRNGRVRILTTGCALEFREDSTVGGLEESAARRGCTLT